MFYCKSDWYFTGYQAAKVKFVECVNDVSRCIWNVFSLFVFFYLKVCMNCLNLSALCESGTMMLMVV